MLTQLLLAVASMTVVVMPDVLAQAGDQPSAQATQSAKKIVATVQAVNAEEKTIKVSEMSEPIYITENTVFDDEVQLSKLQAGTKVQIVGAPSADGKFQASEIRVAK